MSSGGFAPGLPRVPFFRSFWQSALLAIAVAGLDGYANARGERWGDWIATALFAYYAAYCASNFLRCGEVHCAVTAPAFAVTAVLMLLRVAGLAHYDYSLPWIVFVASACVAYCLQWVYRARTGTEYLTR